MKTLKMYALAVLPVTAGLLLAFTSAHEGKHRVVPKGCVFRTVMGEESSDSSFIYKTPLSVFTSLERGLDWIAKAQNQNGGWGAGSHSRQDIKDPHAVASDPATTAMVAMALLRSGNTLTKGEYSAQLKKALNYLMNATESSPASSYNITDQTGTQIQTKLGANIDVVLTSQFFSNILDYLDHDAALKARIKKDLNTCVAKIQRAQDKDGSMSGAGWAGVLQSSFANNALESAQAQGAAVDEVTLEKSREYQKGNYDAKTGEAKTDRGAGIVLYSVSSSSRASAKEARKVQEEMERAKRDGRLSQSAPVSAENLEKIGFDKDDALKYSTAYEVYKSAKVQAQREDVMDGFGSNGGEEFLSYLQTGESMIINKDNEWKNWYDNMSGRVLKIQNEDGSWSGHHCITSPVFCTATCLLILAVNNDIDKLTAIGREK
ncbi:MAG TPA: prenyltransferase/squalene oxidase repeat-containing protein [Cyclobacteriaceae bacterium]